MERNKSKINIRVNNDSPIDVYIAGTKLTVKVNPNDPISVPKAGVISIKAKLNKI
ncbi:MAG TPA: hypothetical protein GXX17_04550 [Clostridiales bacterium]|nr:hypothetical protein [Clostridiales bacterium]